MVEFTGSNGSGLDTSVYGSALTKALNTIAPGQGKDAYELAQLLTPAPREISGPELALQFFSNMAANASQPGSTVLSSAASAIKPTADEYIRQVEANRKSREATGPLAVSLAKALKPAKATKPTIGGYTLVKDIPGVGKAGDPLTMTNVLAEAFVAKHGISSIKEFKTPLVNIGDKAEGKFREVLATGSANAFVEYGKAAENSVQTITDLNTMFEMISGLSGDGDITDDMLATGPIQELTLGIRNLAVSLGIGGVDMDTDVSNALAFKSLVNKVTLGTVAQLKGPLSEKELGFLQAVQPLLGNSVNGNKLIILIQKHAAEKAVNYGKFVSEWRNQEVDGKMRGNPKNTGEFDNMMDAWRQTDDYKIQMPDYISKVTKDFGRKLLENDLEQSRTSGARIYEIDPNTNKFTEEGKAKFIFDINKRIPRTTLNRILGKQNIKDLLSKIREDL